MQGVYLATKMGLNHSKVFVSGGPAKYNEIAYTGAEEPQLPDRSFSGGVWPFWPTWASNPNDIAYAYTETTPTGKTHTGRGSVCVHNNNNGIVYQPDISNWDVTKPFRASVWATSPNVGLYYSIDENSATTRTVVGRADQVANGWYLITLDIPPLGPGSHSSLRVGIWNGTGQDAYVDDFRFQPANAQVTAYVYDQLTGQVSYTLDNNNLYTHYEYGADGSLKRVSRESFQNGGQKVAEYSRHLAGALDATTLDRGYGTVTVNVSELAEPVQIQYDLFDNAGYRPFSTAAGSPYVIPITAARTWVKVRVTDSQGNVRELAKRLL